MNFPLIENLQKKNRKLLPDQESQYSDVKTCGEQLEVLAKQIRGAGQNIKDGLIQSALAALGAGRLLNQAKGMVKHGDWREWLSVNTTMSERTAQLYMRFARKVDEIGGEEQAQRVADLSFRQAMALLGSDQVQADSDARSPRGMRPKIPAETQALRHLFQRLKGAIEPVLSGEIIDPSTNNEAIRTLEALLRYLRERTTAQATSDVIGNASDCSN